MSRSHRGLEEIGLSRARGCNSKARIGYVREPSASNAQDRWLRPARLRWDEMFSGVCTAALFPVAVWVPFGSGRSVVLP